MKKDLITIFAFCPDADRKKILQDLIFSLQKQRNLYDIMVVSHSPISDLSVESVDFFYYDRENLLLEDFDLTNRFWFRGENVMVHSSIVYPKSTHLTIYRLIYYTINFSKFMGYNKTHFMEYDIKMDDYNLIDEVNSKLDEYDNVMFQGDDSWVWGTYFATNNKSLKIENFLYEESKILDDLRSVENRMTEYVTPTLLSNGERTIFYFNIDKIDSEKICQKVDQHLNSTTKWCVPLVLENEDTLSFFIYNEKGYDSSIDVFVDENYFGFKTPPKYIWTLTDIGSLSETKKIEIFVDKILRKKIIFTEENKESFRKNNFYRYF